MNNHSSGKESRDSIRRIVTNRRGFFTVMGAVGVGAAIAPAFSASDKVSSTANTFEAAQRVSMPEATNPHFLKVRDANSKWPTFTVWTYSPSVWAAQYLLTYRGYPVQADGDYDPVTADKVKSFQRAKKLVVDGVLGPVTWPYLMTTVTNGARGSHARAVQSMLNAYWYNVVEDGHYGPVCVSAIRDFQGQLGLVKDGVVGPITWRWLV